MDNDFYAQCGQVDRVLDSTSEGLEFDAQRWSCAKVHTPSVHPVVMGT